MNCLKCNTPIPDEASFCPSCGNPTIKDTNGKPKKHKGCWRAFYIILALFLIVLVLFVVMAIASSSSEGKIAKAMTQIALLDEALQQYKYDVGVYPSSLYCLTENIDKSEKWNGPYIPEVPIDPWGVEYQYLLPGEYDEFDLFSFGADKWYGGEGKNADISKNPEASYHAIMDWKERMIAESKGELINIRNRNRYKNRIVLPGQDVFYGMAKQEATGKQYDKLRNAGYTPDQIANYVMQEKYLPLVREVTGRQNITPQMQLTDQHWAKIKDSMINRQMAGIDKNLMRPDPKTHETNVAYVRTAQNEQMYRDALSQAWDARTQALRNGQDPNKAEINYSEAIKNNKTIMGAINNAARNSW